MGSGMKETDSTMSPFFRREILLWKNDSNFPGSRVGKLLSDRYNAKEWK